jgi:regulator of protease activity HflC (stomatin/prohibitin superfamily)
MTDQGPNQDGPPAEGVDPTPESAAPVSTRGPSVHLRNATSGARGQGGPRMDPANQSLADALRFTYGLLKFAMLILVILFAVSGVKAINEGERGIRVLFGKPNALNLTPGPHWGVPYPMGEMIRIGEGSVEVKIGRAFMPYGTGMETDDLAMAARAEQFSADAMLKPGRSGSNITSDLNIAHTQWTATYRRTDHRMYTENILPEQEEYLVRAAVQRGVVLTLAGVSIDDLLKQSGDSAAAARVREIAQSTLDEMDSGITVDRVTLSRKIPPTYLLDKFNSVQSAAQRAGKNREDALLERDQRLNEVAGNAAPVLIAAINEYERLTELGQADEAEELLAQIDAVLEGRPASIDGQIYAAGLIAGRVSEELEQARSGVSTRVSQAIADRDLFRAKLAQFESNPRLMISRDWSAAMAEFLAKPFVQAMILPSGVTTAELLINEDPAIVRELDRERKRQEAQRAADERMENFRRSVYSTQRGIREAEE